MLRLSSVLALSLLSGLASAAGAPVEVVARAGKIEIDAAQLKTLVSALPTETRSALLADPAQLEQFVRAELASRVLVADAEAAGFDKKPETTADLARLRNEGIARLWLADRSKTPAAFPSDADVAAAYEQSMTQLRAPAEFHLAQVFIAAPDGMDAAKLAAALKKSADVAAKLAGKSPDFGKLAREQSEQAETAAKDGDLGWMAANRLLPEVQRAVAGLKAGEVAGPVKTAQGFHFIKLLEAKPERQLTLDESRATLVQALRARRAQELQQKFLADLSAKQPVSVNQIALGALQGQLK